VPLGGTKQRAVLALLVLHANNVVSVDRLIDELWGEHPPESAANMLQGYVSRLRKVLEPHRRRGEHELLVSRPPGYVLQISAEQLDAERFARLVDDGRRLLEDGDVAAAAAQLRAALELWRGPALGDLAYEPFAQHEAERLEELRLLALEDRVDADLAAGRHDVLVPELQELVAKHPLRERLCAQLMAALYRSGRQVEALEVYRRTSRALRERLGIEPGPALVQLERAILEQDPELGTAAPPRQVAGRRRRRFVLAAVAVVAVLAGAVLLGATMLDRSSTPPPVAVGDNSVAVIDPTEERVVADIPVGGYPGPLTADDEFVYVCSIGDATVTRIRAATRKRWDTFSFSRAIDLVALDGHLWAADGGAPGHTPLGVSPGTIFDYAPGPTWNTIRVGPNIDGSEEQTTIASDGGGYSIWAGNEDSRTVRQVDASTRMTLMTIHGNAASGLTAVGDSHGGDTVWVADRAANVVARIDEHARRVVRRIHVPDGPTRLVADADAVWVLTRKRHAVWRIDARTNHVTARIPLPLLPWRVAIGAGSVWVTGYRITNARTRSSTDAEVLRIDPETNRLATRIPLGADAANGIVVSHGLVWVAVPPSQ
jgi:YVTN family beta-propeller protein